MVVTFGRRCSRVLEKLLLQCLVSRRSRQFTQDLRNTLSINTARRAESAQSAPRPPGYARADPFLRRRNAGGGARGQHHHRREIPTVAVAHLAGTSLCFA